MHRGTACITHASVKRDGTRLAMSSGIISSQMQWVKLTMTFQLQAKSVSLAMGQTV